MDSGTWVSFGIKSKRDWRDYSNSIPNSYFGHLNKVRKQQKGWGICTSTRNTQTRPDKMLESKSPYTYIVSLNTIFPITTIVIMEAAARWILWCLARWHGVDPPLHTRFRREWRTTTVGCYSWFSHRAVSRQLIEKASCTGWRWHDCGLPELESTHGLVIVLDWIECFSIGFETH